MIQKFNINLGVPGAQRVAIAKRLLIERGNCSFVPIFHLMVNGLSKSDNLLLGFIT